MYQRPDKEGKTGLRIVIDPDSTICERVREIIGQAEDKGGEISGQDHVFVTAHLVECDRCHKSWGEKFSKLKLDIPS